MAKISGHTADGNGSSLTQQIRNPIIHMDYSLEQNGTISGGVALVMARNYPCVRYKHAMAFKVNKDAYKINYKCIIK